MSEPAKAAEKKKEARTASHASEVTRPGFFVKLVLMMLIDALGIYGMFTAYLVKSWTVLAVLAVLLLVVNWVYFSKRTIPAKYLVPGMVFLLIYQVFVMGYTGLRVLHELRPGPVTPARTTPSRRSCRRPSSAPRVRRTCPPLSSRTAPASGSRLSIPRRAPSAWVTPRLRCTKCPAPTPPAC